MRMKGDNVEPSKNPFKAIDKGFLLRNKRKLIQGVLIIVILVLALTVLNHKTNANEQLNVETADSLAVSQEQVEKDEEAGVIIVDIGGQVNNPTVVELKNGDRVIDAIKAAGGLTKDADISNINRAEVLIDGQKITIPSIKDNTSHIKNINNDTTNNDTTNNLININTSTQDELEAIPGVGPSTAKKIIEYRDSNGAFAKIEDIKNVSGIGDKTFLKMKAKICV